MNDKGYTRTAWWCERCHASGVLKHLAMADVMSVVTAIYDAHDESELGLLAVPICHAHADSVRIQFDSLDLVATKRGMGWRI